MSEIIEVIYENGVLKPLKKLPFREGERLIVEIKRGDKKKLLDELEGSIKLKKRSDLKKFLSWRMSYGYLFRCKCDCQFFALY